MGADVRHIWTIVLSRASGPGPLAGALAILVMDTGSFGQSFSEALVNVDGRQIEGVGIDRRETDPTLLTERRDIV